MQKVRLGRTEMMVSQVGFGGVPIQRLSENEAVAVVNRCIDLGITYIDTAAEYSNSEERIGKAIKGRREKLIIATKSNYGTPQEVESHLKQSLKHLGGYIDLYQFHLIKDFDLYARAIDPKGPLGVLQKAKKAGLIRHIGITTHQMDVAKEAVKSGIFETILYPFNFVTSEPADELLPLAKKHDVGFIAMKPLAGGIIQNIPVAFKYLTQFPEVVSIVGIQKEREIDEIMEVVEAARPMTRSEQREMQRLRADLGMKLCRRCAYCEPCPEGVPVLHLMDLMPFVINMPPQHVFSDLIFNRLEKLSACNECGECEKKCPYGLPVVEIIKEHFSSYQAGRRKFQKRKAPAKKQPVRAPKTSFD